MYICMYVCMSIYIYHKKNIYIYVYMYIFFFKICPGVGVWSLVVKPKALGVSLYLQTAHNHGPYSLHLGTTAIILGPLEVQVEASKNRGSYYRPQESRALS